MAEALIADWVEGANELESLVPPHLLALGRADHQRAIPTIAKDPAAAHAIELAIRSYATRHDVRQGDSRDLTSIEDASLHLVVTSPPYWTLKRYRDTAGQLGHIADYMSFLDGLDAVWRHVYRVLVPGGRSIVVVGDVNVSRRTFGRHLVFPLHASIQERCRHIGFDNLAPIIWHKISNARFEVEGSSGFLGKPYEPGAVVKNDIEYILFQRKPGGYRQPSLGARLLSVIPEPCQRDWFQQIWTLPGASTRNHPAPYPLELAERLIRMFSFVGDTVLRPVPWHWHDDPGGGEMRPAQHRPRHRTRVRVDGARTSRWVACKLGTAVSLGPVPTGLSLTDRLATLRRPTVVDSVVGASEYVRSARSLGDGQRKAAQIRLWAALGRALLEDLRERLPQPSFGAIAGEREVSGDCPGYAAVPRPVIRMSNRVPMAEAMASSSWTRSCDPRRSDTAISPLLTTESSGDRDTRSVL